MKIDDPNLFFDDVGNVAERSEKDRCNRYKAYVQWLSEEHRSWLRPDLVAYRDFLLNQKRMSPSSVKSHLSTIRTRYRSLLESGELRRLMSEAKVLPSPLQSTESVDAVTKEIQQAIRPDVSAVEAPRPDGGQFRLSKAQAEQLRSLPDRRSLEGIRDVAIIDLILNTGIRVAELCSLTVSDLHMKEDGWLVLRIGECTGCTERTIPYRNNRTELHLTLKWLEAAEITDGFVFRAFYKTRQQIRATRLSPGAVAIIVESYPLSIDGQAISVTPMVLRRTYASRLFRGGVPLKEIAVMLGVSATTAAQYVGAAILGSEQDDPYWPLENPVGDSEDPGAIPF